MLLKAAIINIENNTVDIVNRSNKVILNKRSNQH